MAKTGLAPRTAVWVAAARLCTWHALQPLTYTVSLLAFWRDLSYWEHACGGVVLLREIAMLVVLPLLCIVQPSALLVDVAASSREFDEDDFDIFDDAMDGMSTSTVGSSAGNWESLSLAISCGLPAVALLSLAPEKLIFMWLAVKVQGRGHVYAALGLGLFAALLTIIELFAVGALAAGLHEGATPPPLIVGWTTTAVAGIATVAIAGSSDGSPCGGGCRGGLTALCGLVLSVGAPLDLLGIVMPTTPDVNFIIAAPSVFLLGVAVVCCLYPSRNRMWHGVRIEAIGMTVLRFSVLAALVMIILFVIDELVVPEQVLR